MRAASASPPGSKVIDEHLERLARQVGDPALEIPARRSIAKERARESHLDARPCARARRQCGRERAQQAVEHRAVRLLQRDGRPRPGMRAGNWSSASRRASRRTTSRARVAATRLPAPQVPHRYRATRRDAPHRRSPPPSAARACVRSPRGACAGRVALPRRTLPARSGARHARRSVCASSRHAVASVASSRAARRKSSAAGARSLRSCNRPASVIMAAARAGVERERAAQRLFGAGIVTRKPSHGAEVRPCERVLVVDRNGALECRERFVGPSRIAQRIAEVVPAARVFGVGAWSHGRTHRSRGRNARHPRTGCRARSRHAPALASRASAPSTSTIARGRSRSISYARARSINAANRSDRSRMRSASIASASARAPAASAGAELVLDRASAVRCTTRSPAITIRRLEIARVRRHVGQWRLARCLRRCRA